jgi:hypothetical protein
MMTFYIEKFIYNYCDIVYTVISKYCIDLKFCVRQYIHICIYIHFNGWVMNMYHISTFCKMLLKLKPLCNIINISILNKNFSANFTK